MGVEKDSKKNPVKQILKDLRTAVDKLEVASVALSDLELHELSGEIYSAHQNIDSIAHKIAVAWGNIQAERVRDNVIAAYIKPEEPTLPMGKDVEHGFVGD